MTMRVLIGYESLYGNTHHIADAIASGFLPDDVVDVKPISETDPAAAVDVLVIGTPTHAHGLPRVSSRQAALDSAHTRSEQHTVDPDATVETGVREWLTRLPAHLAMPVAVFDTRFRLPTWVVGHPARGISRALVRRGSRLLVPAKSFYVDRHEQLRPGELERARTWGTEIRSRTVTYLDEQRRISSGPPAR